jgi:hypothetical protein
MGLEKNLKKLINIANFTDVNGIYNFDDVRDGLVYPVFNINKTYDDALGSVLGESFKNNATGHFQKLNIYTTRWVAKWQSEKEGVYVGNGEIVPDEKCIYNNYLWATYNVSVGLFSTVGSMNNVEEPIESSLRWMTYPEVLRRTFYVKEVQRGVYSTSAETVEELKDTGSNVLNLIVLGGLIVVGSNLGEILFGVAKSRVGL